MVKVDNDATKYAALPFVIIAGVRTGGTYLSHCLSNHPDAFCDRAESVHHNSVWRRKARCLDSVQLLDLLTHMEGYHASGFKITYRQVHQLWRYITSNKPHIIHLTRRNWLRQGVSSAYNQQVRRAKIKYYPVHSFKETRPPEPVKIPTGTILYCCRRMVRDEQSITKLLNGYRGKVLHVTYEDLVGGEGQTRGCIVGATQAKICKFLEIPSRRLCCGLKRVHNHPLRAMFSNWDEIERAIKDSEFARFLKEEEAWVEVNGKWQIKT